jgi:hypothetical protein
MGLNIFIHEEKSMKKRYLNLALAALVVLFAFAGCSGGDDPPLNWPAEIFKDIGLKGLELPSGIGITANGSEEKTVAGKEDYIEYVRWDNASKGAFDALLASLQAKVAANGDITNLSTGEDLAPTGTAPYYAHCQYDYDGETYYVLITLTRKAYPSTDKLGVYTFEYESPSGALWLFMYTSR